MKHTQGEWYLTDGLLHDLNVCPINYYEISNKKDMLWVAHVAAGSMRVDGEAEANAKLISAAPELLQVVKKALAIFGSEEHYPEGTIGYRIAQDAKKAISKAT